MHSNWSSAHTDAVRRSHLGMYLGRRGSGQDDTEAELVVQRRGSANHRSSHDMRVPALPLMCASGIGKVGVPWPAIFIVVDALRGTDQENYGACRSDAVVLSYRSYSAGSNEWKSVQQRVPINLTACHFGGVRPWLSVRSIATAATAGAGRYPLRRGRTFCLSAVLWLVLRKPTADGAASQLGAARKIRTRLGGTADLLEPFPARPKGMHQRTFQRLRAPRKWRCPLDEVSPGSALELGHCPVGRRSLICARHARRRCV